MLPIEVYFANDNLSPDISSTMIGDIGLFFYKKTLIGFIHHGRHRMEVVKLPLASTMYLRNVEVRYPLSATEINPDHIDYLIKRASYPADHVVYHPHPTLCRNAQRAIMEDTYRHYSAHN